MRWLWQSLCRHKLLRERDRNGRRGLWWVCQRCGYAERAPVLKFRPKVQA